MARNPIAPGGYIGGEPPRRPMFNQLSGVWKLDDVLDRQRNNSWANALGVEDVFSTWLYTGNGSTQTITNGIDLSGNGGLVWFKQRNSSSSHELVDTARGVGKGLDTRTDGAQTSLTDLTSFTSSGFSLGYNTGNANFNTGTFASWTFRKQAKFFDVVTYTGNGTNNDIAHSLGVAPGFILIKRTDSISDWFAYPRYDDSGNATFPYLYKDLKLNTTDASAGNLGGLASSTILRANSTGGNINGATYVAYLFAHNAGGFGDSGNDSVVSCGTFDASATVTLGWEPQWLLIKNSGGVADWNIVDNMRGWPINGNANRLQPNTSDSEATLGTARITATGFTYNAGDSNTYIYIAIRRGPMKTPTDATKVFSAVLTSNNLDPYSIGFPTDMAIIGYRGGSALYSQTVGTRLTGNSASLFTSKTDAEKTNAGVVWSFDLQNSFNQQWNALSPSWNFRRAPGFFDVVAYTGTGVARTVNHNLGVAPELMIVKGRDAVSVWAVYYGNPTQKLFLNFTNATAADSTFWNDTASTSTVFTVGTGTPTNSNGAAFIAYLFATCPGVSKVGSYTGTGTTLNVDCGFTAGARFVLIKRTDSTGDWYVWDTARGVVSGNDPYLLFNSTAAEVTNTDYIDPLNAGFQISSTAPAAINANGGSFIFFAIA